MQEDAILVQKTIDGDEQAFHRLIMKYYTKIYALILSWVKKSRVGKGREWSIEEISELKQKYTKLGFGFRRHLNEGD